MVFVRSYLKINRWFFFIDCCIVCMCFKYFDEFCVLVVVDEYGVVLVMWSNSRLLLNMICVINVFLGVIG